MTTSVELQREIRREVEERLGHDRVKALHEKSARPTLFTLAHLWTAIAVTFAAAGEVVTWSLPSALGVGFLLAAFMATRINALNVLVHEGSHHALASGRGLNTLLTNLGAGYWMGYDEASYRSVHGPHHRHLNEPDDPDYTLYDLAPGRARLLLDLFGYVFFVAAFKRVLAYRGMAAVQTSREGTLWSRLGHRAGKIAANGGLVATLVVLNGPIHGVVVYVACWVVPLVSLYPLIIRVRVITEHFSPQVVDRAAPPVFVARTSLCGPLQHYLLGAKMDYHFEHHLFPGIPYHQLGAMHAELEATGFFQTERADLLSGGYLAFWRRLWQSDYLAGRAPSGGLV